MHGYLSFILAVLIGILWAEIPARLGLFAKSIVWIRNVLR